MGYEYLRNESIIRSKTREFFGVGTVVTASAYLVSVVDFMLIGALLGADAVAAAGLCDSFVDVAELFGFVLSSGGPVAAGILLGKRRLRQANGVFTLSLLLTLAGGLLCWCLLPFCGFFSGVLSNNGAIANDVARYAFFTLLSSPFVGVNLVLSSFAILDDRSKLAMGSVVAANGVNIVLDVVFMKYLRMSVAGAAAASLLGNAAGILVVLPYLLSKKRTFRFVLRADDLRETGRELASSCSSFATDKASRIFSGLTVNLLLMYFVGNIGVALYAVYSQLRFILRILAGGALQTISTLGSMLYGERDFYGLRKMLSLLSKYTYALVAALMAGLFCFSAPFLNSYGIAAEPDTVLSLRIMLLSLPFLWLNDLLTRLYPSVQRQRLSVLLLTLQNVVLKILLLLLCVAAISRLHWRSVPAVAVWCLLVELLSPAVTLLREKRTCGNVALLGLEDQADRSCHSFSITGKAENVADIHREIDLFCQQNGIPRNKGVLLAIAFEEAALNIINHNEHVSMIDICLLLEEGSLIVRIRDDGAPFDPLAFVDDEDILAALESGKVARYVTDFPNNRLLTAPHVIAMPHLGASTPESEQNCAAMAVDTLRDYLESGNIRSSVNLPEMTMDRSGVQRLCVLHKNVPGMLANITSLFGRDGVNVENLSNKSRGDYAYTMVDLGSKVGDNVIEDVRRTANVIRVRSLEW